MESGMIREYSQRIQVRLFLLFACFLFIFNSHAQPNPEFVSALWVSQEHNLLKISSATGQSLFQIPVTRNTSDYY